MSDKATRLAGARRANRRPCDEHGAAFKAQFRSALYRCGYGCEVFAPEWPHEHGWATAPEPTIDQAAFDTDEAIFGAQDSDLTPEDVDWTDVLDALENIGHLHAIQGSETPGGPNVITLRGPDRLVIAGEDEGDEPERFVQVTHDNGRVYIMRTGDTDPADLARTIDGALAADLTDAEVWTEL